LNLKRIEDITDNKEVNMKVGDLVVRKVGDRPLKDRKGIILSIRQGAHHNQTYYKIKWFNIHYISDKWTDVEFEVYNRSTREEQ